MSLFDTRPADRRFLGWAILFTLIGAALNSLWCIYIDDVVNNDAVEYIRAAERFFAELGAVRDRVKKDVKIATVASRVRDGGKTTEALEDFLYDVRLPSGRRFPFLTLLRQNANYLKAAERGLSIFEFAPMATAVDREYWRPLVRWLASARSMPQDAT